MNYTPEQLREIYLKLPGDLRDAIFSVEMSDIIRDIGVKNKLTIDKIGALADETNLVMLGLVHPNDFISNLALRLKIDKDHARLMAQAVNVQIFQKVRDSLRKIHGMGGGEDGEESPGRQPQEGQTERDAHPTMPLPAGESGGAAAGYFSDIEQPKIRTFYTLDEYGDAGSETQVGSFERDKILKEIEKDDFDLPVEFPAKNEAPEGHFALDKYSTTGVIAEIQVKPDETAAVPLVPGNPLHKKDEIPDILKGMTNPFEEKMKKDIHVAPKEEKKFEENMKQPQFKEAKYNNSDPYRESIE